MSNFKPGDLVTVEFTTPTYRRDQPNPSGDYTVTGRVYTVDGFGSLWVGQHILVDEEGDLAVTIASARRHAEVSA